MRKYRIILVSCCNVDHGMNRKKGNKFTKTIDVPQKKTRHIVKLFLNSRKRNTRNTNCTKYVYNKL